MKKIYFIALVCFVILTKTTAQTNPFEKEIAAFEALDAKNPPVAGQILLYGSSTIRMWLNYDVDFACKNLKVVNRGFGGSQTSDANLFFDRVVVPQQPKYIFFYEGDNDINAGKSVDSVFMAYQTFVQKVKTQSPKTKVILFSIKPSPSRIQHFDKQRELNKKLWKWVKRTKNVYFIDVFSRMLDKDGKPDAQFFRPDMLHMKPEGYVIWTKEVQKLLKRLEK
jgi:lysophospholipase L1-like esterase